MRNMNRMFGQTVIMAEKRNAAEDIAVAIGLKNIRKEGNSHFLHGTDERGNDIVIVWSNGHCLELQEPDDIDEKYKKWSVDDLPIPLVSDKILIPKKDKQSLLNDISSMLKTAKTIINAGDAGREGELIQRWILAYAGEIHKPIKRLWVQSLTPSAIKKAYDNLLGDTEEEKNRLNNLYDSGRARAIMDKYIGYNYSRLISLTQTEGVTVNYGRCKSPLVAAIVQRDKEIENFISTPFSYIELSLEKDGFDFKATLVDENGKRKDFTDEEKSALDGAIKKISKDITVDSITKKGGYKLPPQPFDTLTLQKEMANKHGYSADKTLELMEKLYDTHHILTYPRTDTRYFTNDIKDELKTTLSHLSFGEYEQHIPTAEEGYIPDKYFNDAKIADHHAIAPIAGEDIVQIYDKLSKEERNVFDCVVKNFIALYLPKYEYETTEVILKEDDLTFKVKGTKDKALGYKMLYPKKKPTDGKEESSDNIEDQFLPEIEEDESLSITSWDVKKSKTKPKSRFTTSSLLDYMKAHNIGTGATRDRIIKDLTDIKGYNKEACVIKKGKYYMATQLGKNMDEVIPNEIKSIEYLKELEGEIQDIADGKLSFDSFIKKMESDFVKRSNYLIENKGKKLIQKKPDKALRDDMQCPACGLPLTEMKWGYSCSGWSKDGTGCNFTIPKEICKQKLTETIVKELITSKRTSAPLKNMRSKKGNKFDAYLLLKIAENGKSNIQFEFSND